MSGSVDFAAVARPVESSSAERARSRIRRRLLPFLFLLYVVAYLDRINVGYAALEMTGDLHLAPDVYGFGAGIFFLGYFLLQIPGSIAVEKWSARRLIAGILVAWGIVAIFTGFIRTADHFYCARFLLGAAEAGFFPGIVVYLTHWIPYKERATALALFLTAQPISSIIGSPISGLLLGIRWFGLAGWRWLFILEGLPAVILGAVTLFYLTDWPNQAEWLADDEREWINSELENEKRSRSIAKAQSVLQTLCKREVLLLCAVYFCLVSSVFGFTFWLPTILKKLSGLSNFAVSAIAALPYCVGLLAMLVNGWSSDRRNERRWHTAVCCMCISLGLGLSVVPNGAALPMLMFCVAAVGMYGYLPSFWSIPSSFLSGTAAAAAIGLINSFGNLGGFVGPYVVGYLTKTTHSFAAGVSYLSVSAAAAAVLVLLVRPRELTRGTDISNLA